MRYKGREAHEFIKDRTNKYPTDIYNISSPRFNVDAAYQYLNDLYWSGTPNRTGGRETGIYLLTGNNCATTVRNALEVGGFHVLGGSPAELGSSIGAILNLRQSLKLIYP